MSLALAPDLLAFSHLRWGPAADRPQQLMSLLAPAWRVCYVEEPVSTDGPPRLEVHRLGPQLTVLVPHTPLPAAGFDAQQLAAIQPLLADWLARARVTEPVAWLTTPMALPWARSVQPACIVYDCMEDLGGRALAPAALPRLEVELLAEASIVFAGGPSLFQALRHLHPNVHCVPSSVDVEHFSPSKLDFGGASGRQVQALQGALARPRLGCLDAVDERIDLELLVQLADERAGWSIVMAGPVASSLSALLPQRPNLHWLGPQPYERLPYLLAGWDLCLLPYGQHASTRLLSPTSTLQYMAAEKPVVSTAVADVVMLHGDAVAVAHSARSFIETCDQVLAEGAAAHFMRQREMINTVSTTSWQRTAASVQHLLSAAHLAACRGRELRRWRAVVPGLAPVEVTVVAPFDAPVVAPVVASSPLRRATASKPARAAA